MVSSPFGFGFVFPFFPIFADHCYLFQMFILEPSLLASPYQGQWFFGQFEQQGPHEGHALVVCGCACSTLRYWKKKLCCLVT